MHHRARGKRRHGTLGPTAIDARRVETLVFPKLDLWSVLAARKYHDQPNISLLSPYWIHNFSIARSVFYVLFELTAP